MKKQDHIDLNVFLNERKELVKIPHKERTFDQHYRFFYLDALLRGKGRVTRKEAEAYARTCVVHNVTDKEVNPKDQETTKRVIERKWTSAENKTLAPWLKSRYKSNSYQLFPYCPGSTFSRHAHLAGFSAGIITVTRSPTRA